MGYVGVREIHLIKTLKFSCQWSPWIHVCVIIVKQNKKRQTLCSSLLLLHYFLNLQTGNAFFFYKLLEILKKKHKKYISVLENIYFK